MKQQTRGCAATLLIIFGSIACAFALLVAVACVDGAMEGDLGIAASGLAIGVPIALAAALLMRKGISLKRQGTAARPAAGGPVAEGASSGKIVEITTVAGTTSPENEMAPSASVAPAPVAAAVAPVADAAGQPGFPLEKAVLRSSNVFATLKDFAAHPQDDPYDASLAAMLNALGIADWSDAPKIEAVKLGRSDCFWLGSNTDGLSDESLDRYLGVECALNVSQAMRRGTCSALDVLRGISGLEPRASRNTLPGVAEGAAEQGEWMSRLRFAEFVENVPVPYRMAFGMQANVASGLFAIDLTVPRPNTMAFIAANATGRIGAARAYALRSALLCARKAFELNPAIRQVVVNCGVVRNKEALISFNLDRAALARLLPASHDPAIDTTGFPADPSIRASFDADGWFLPVEPFLAIDAEAAAPRGRFAGVELDHGPASAALAASCGIRTISDLGINENACRVAAWRDVSAHMGGSTGDAVARLVAVRDAAQDVSVAEAAERVSKALVEGSVDVSDTDALAKMFVEGALLDTVAAKAREALGEAEHADLEAMLASLEDALAPIAAMGAYLDDSDQIYRYFNAPIERVWFNLNLDDHERTVRLVPDSYYAARTCAARILTLLDRGEEALAHADELVRIAPATPDAALVRVRALESLSRIYDASDVLKETISRCSWVNDLAVCFYRLAYMEWKLGRSDLAVACYERAIMMQTPILQPAKDELAELLESDSSLAHLSGDETLAALAAAGIPAGDTDGLRGLAARAAIAATDANLHSAAASLTGTLIDAGRDDVLIDIFHSLRVGI